MPPNTFGSTLFLLPNVSTSSILLLYLITIISSPFMVQSNVRVSCSCVYPSHHSRHFLSFTVLPFLHLPLYLLPSLSIQYIRLSHLPILSIFCPRSNKSNEKMIKSLKNTPNDNFQQCLYLLFQWVTFRFSHRSHWKRFSGAHFIILIPLKQQSNEMANPFMCCFTLINHIKKLQSSFVPHTMWLICRMLWTVYHEKI